VLSPAFFAKVWTQRELDGLVAKEQYGDRVVLPVWHNVDRAKVAQYSLTLADRVAVLSSGGIEHVVDELRRAIGSS
jgi:hypothetical protein